MLRRRALGLGSILVRHGAERGCTAGPVFFSTLRQPTCRSEVTEAGIYGGYCPCGRSLGGLPLAHHGSKDCLLMNRLDPCDLLLECLRASPLLWPALPRKPMIEPNAVTASPVCALKS